MIHLDTHVLVWVLAGEHDRLTRGVRRLLEAERLVYSPMLELELTYLHEIGRVRLPAAEVLAELTTALELTRSRQPFEQVVAHAQPLTWTRDPFDRLLCGNALADGARLLTADTTMREHLSEAVWPD